MHTSSSVDATDEFSETVTKNGAHWTYKHGNDQLPVRETVVSIPYKTATGMAERKFTVLYTMHGPVTRETADGKWVSFSAMNSPVKALTQSYTRTKAHNLEEYKKNFDLHTNSSNNTLFADASGNIAYFHANYIPRRDPKFDWRQAVDGSDPATDYKGLLSFDESPNVINPASGWVYNTNNSPWTAAGPSSLKQADYPKYVDNGSESARSAHAIRVLSDRKDFTLDGLRLAAFDSYQGTYFEKPLSALFAAYDAAPASPLKTKIAEQIGLLRKWDMRWGAKSLETSVAIYWAEDLQRNGGRGGRGGRGRGAGGGAAAAPDSAAIREQMLQSLANASDKLTTDFGSWKTPWGDINRFQRLTDDIVHPFADAGASIPVEFSTANFGSLASFATRQPQGAIKRYGVSGNSFVAVVEFGDSVRAKAVTAGGESGDPKSKHFNDQAQRYATGNLRDVYFYKAQLKGHTEREYHPGGD
jgi:acyl-homoserine lactone acylase PvdQ